VYPVHRLDRQTGGVLLFALDSDSTRKVQQQFVSHDVDKSYLSLVRGFTEDQGTIDRPLKTDRGNMQDALTHYKTVQRFEVPIAMGKFNSSRYSLVEVTPKTGRTHQIRRHFAHISHPIIGDRRHGCNRQNNLFRDHELLGLQTMLLHASSLKFKHPETSVEMMLNADLQTPFRMIVDALTAISLSSEEIMEKMAQESALRDEEKRVCAASSETKRDDDDAICSLDGDTGESVAKRQRVYASEGGEKNVDGSTTGRGSTS